MPTFAIQISHIYWTLDATVNFALLKETVPDLEIQVTEAESIRLLSSVNWYWIYVRGFHYRSGNGNGARQQGCADFYAEVVAKIRIQHILYDADDLRQLFEWIDQGVVLCPTSLSVLWVLGRYSSDGNSDPAELNQVEATLRALGSDIPEQVMICAFGLGQIPCLVEVARRGWDCRVGFENGWWKQDGSIAQNNADLLQDLRDQLVRRK